MNKTKRSIFESAIKVFSIYGYDVATMDEIAAEAGVAKGTLYYHFKSKEEIFRYIIEEGMKLISSRIEGVVKQESDSMSKLKALCKVQLSLVYDNRNFFKVIMSQLWGQELRQLQLRESIEQYIKDIPPFFANAIAILLSETDCIIADVKGILSFNSGSSPFLYLIRGVLKSTFSTTQSFVVRFGKSKYSPKVLEGSPIILVISFVHTPLF